MNKTLYNAKTGWIVVHLSAYIAWQGHISELPTKYESLLYKGQEQHYSQSA